MPVPSPIGAGVPLPSITGGAAAPSAAVTGDFGAITFGNISQGGGGSFWLAIAGLAAAGFLVWKWKA